MASSVYIALGTNLGDRQENLQQALLALKARVRILECSPVYETEPWGYTDQPAFLNQVIHGETELPPLELLDFLKEIEQDMGRNTEFRYGPRIIDLDILFYADLHYQGPRLEIPHPRLGERAFVLVPLAELAPRLCHPQTGSTVQELLEKTGSSGIQEVTTTKDPCP